MKIVSMQFSRRRTARGDKRCFNASTNFVLDRPGSWELSQPLEHLALLWMLGLMRLSSTTQIFRTPAPNSLCLYEQQTKSSACWMCKALQRMLFSRKMSKCFPHLQTRLPSPYRMLILSESHSNCSSKPRRHLESICVSRGRPCKHRLHVLDTSYLKT